MYSLHCVPLLALFAALYTSYSSCSTGSEGIPNKIKVPGYDEYEDFPYYEEMREDEDLSLAVSAFYIKYCLPMEDFDTEKSAAFSIFRHISKKNPLYNSLLKWFLPKNKSNLHDFEALYKLTDSAYKSLIDKKPANMAIMIENLSRKGQLVTNFVSALIERDFESITVANEAFQKRIDPIRYFSIKYPLKFRNLTGSELFDGTWYGEAAVLKMLDLFYPEVFKSLSGGKDEMFAIEPKIAHTLVVEKLLEIPGNQKSVGYELPFVSGFLHQIKPREVSLVLISYIMEMGFWEFVNARNFRIFLEFLYRDHKSEMKYSIRDTLASQCRFMDHGAFADHLTIDYPKLQEMYEEMVMDLRVLD